MSLQRDLNDSVFHGNVINQKSGMSLQELVEKLHILFSEERINVDEVKAVMESCQSRPSDWERYAHFDQYRYTRNLVDDGNGKFNLIALCWSEGQGSGIHDHSNSHCFMKVLDGQVKETLYGWPDENGEEYQQMNPVAENVYSVNQVAYINDTIGLHRVENPSHTNPAVTLHLYCPPFDYCRSFDDRTGKTNKCKVTFWSQFGVRTPYGKSCGPYEATVEK